MRISEETIDAAIEHLSSADRVLREVIRDVGRFRLRLHRDRFGLLVRSIISQQISTKAARAIRLRLEALLAPGKPTPEKLTGLADEQLRAAGLSSQKVTYLRDLSQKVLQGEVCLRQIGRKGDERVIEELTRVKGIGRWTAQMFLIFSLGRLDVFPHDDLGIRSRIRDLYGLKELPHKQTALRIAKPWRPYASVACWYCWQSADGVTRAQSGESGYPV